MPSHPKERCIEKMTTAAVARGTGGSGAFKSSHLEIARTRSTSAAKGSPYSCRWAGAGGTPAGWISPVSENSGSPPAAVSTTVSPDAVEVVSAGAGYRSPGKIIFSVARAPILTATYVTSQVKRTVTNAAQLMGSVNHGKTSAVPRSVNPSEIAHAHRRMNSAYLRIRTPLVGTG